MEMYDVLNKLKAIENPSEDEQAAIKSAEAMNNPTNPSAKPETVQTPQETAPTMMPETNTVSATGQDVYQPVAEETPTEYARLAGVQTLNVQTDAPETTTESAEVKEAQSPAQKAAFKKMLDAKKGKTEDKEEETIEEAKPDFLDLDKDGDKKEPMKKAAKDKEEMKEEDTTPEQYEKNEKVSEEEEILDEVEEIELDEAYDPAHVKGIVDKHEKEGHKVQMDRPEDGAQGFTVTFKDGKKRHYKYTKSGVKVQSMEPEEPMVDPNAPKRGKGRPKKESEELNLDSMMEDFEKKYSEQLNEGLQVTQSIDDEGQETININANNAHADMVKDLMKLSGMRSDGYKEYEGDPEAVEEERDPEYTNSPREKTSTVDAQVKDMSGGLNGPKDKSALKSNSNALHTESKNDIAENMMNLYAKYKGN